MDHELAENRRVDRPPRGRTELARVIKADKGGLTRMLDSGQDTYKYARQISELLNIPYAMVSNPELTDGVTDDEWAIYVADAKRLPEPEQRRMLRMFRAALKSEE